LAVRHTQMRVYQEWQDAALEHAGRVEPEVRHDRRRREV